MTRCVVGTYRKRRHIEAALRSLDTVVGVTDLVFVDDSGDEEHCEWLRKYGTVVEVGGKGYAPAMQTVCDVAEGEDIFLLEEDFTIHTPVDLDAWGELLRHRPRLAQICLLRPPHSREEIRLGGIIEMFRYYGDPAPEVGRLIIQQTYFSCNPSLCKGEVMALGWPQVENSEVAFTKQLRAIGYQFAYWPAPNAQGGIGCRHHGERTGKGY